MLALTTVGRRTGTQRATIVAYLRDGQSYVIYGSNLGSERDPAWALNLQANPEAGIHVEGRDLSVTARRAEGDEAARLWALYVQRLPAADPFAEIAERQIPIFILQPQLIRGLAK